MRIRRGLPIFFGFVIFLAAVALVVTLRKHAPPESARLLPGADGFFYVNLKWIRTLSSAEHIPNPFSGPEYDEFVKDTGFEFQHDLDQAAFAVHYPQSWGDGTGGNVNEPRFSEVFIGK